MIVHQCLLVGIATLLLASAAHAQGAAPSTAARATLLSHAYSIDGAAAAAGLPQLREVSLPMQRRRCRIRTRCRQGLFGVLMAGR